MSRKTTDIPEHELVAKLTQDDKDAFAELYTRYKGRLLYFAMEFVKSRDFAEDVYQDAFTAIWQTRKFINPDLPFATFLYTIVRNRIFNLLRNIEMESALKEQILANATDHSNNTQESLTALDLQNTLDKALAQLTPKQREVFELSRKTGLSHKEIALRLNISVLTVKSHITASLKILQDYLRKYYGHLAEVILLLLLLN
ncbi:MAG: RNA polymerase sigma-70 factor [Candidatus Symbiothrix sp.]|jgi:RNA polymerase sigma-70 factor (ECF subfamily)|nr:RNA polymerase sigma-70 factor [Candidatus Symbiothrix sp.]